MTGPSDPADRLDPVDRPDPATPPGGTPPAPGRPRDPRIDDHVLDAVVDVLRDHGWAGLSVEAVARRACVSKPAIYRRWSSLGRLTVDAVARRLLPDAVADTGDLRDDLVAGLGQIVETLADPPFREAVRGVLSGFAADPDLRARWFEAVLLPRRASTGRALQAAIDRGELRADLDLEQVLDALAGPLYYRGLFAHGPLDRAFVEATVDGVLAAHRP